MDSSFHRSLLEEGQVVRRALQEFAGESVVEHHQVVNVDLEQVMLHADGRAEHVSVHVGLALPKAAKELSELELRVSRRCNRCSRNASSLVSALVREEHRARIEVSHRCVCARVC